MSQTQASLLGDTFGSKASGAIPIGGIIMWSGTTIPTGWALCNGSNGTPNLQDKFVVGAGSGYAVAATGGSANATLVSHTHTASTDSAGTHAHKVLVAQNSSSNTTRIDNNAAGFTGDGGNDIYVLNNNNELGQQMVEDAGSHSHTVTVAVAGSSATNANLPPYYALAFIMRTS